MDYPKSVPSVGLIDGKFVDEDPLSGTPGSLVPAQWGNAVTLEILNVIESAGLIPDEDDNTQLRAAIAAGLPAATELVAGKAQLATLVDAETGTDNAKIMTPLRVFQAIAKKVVQATETVFGWAKVSTQALTDAGSDDATFVTPKKLRWGFTSTFANNGYIVFPSWLGGFIIQWIRTTNLGSQGASSSFPLAFPTACFGVWGSSTNGSSPTTISVGAITLTTFTAYAGTVPISFGAIAFGR